MATDIFEWAEESPPMEAALTNLFLHHFENPGITRLFTALARKSTSFAAAEPSRNYLAFLATQTLGLIGFHPVTRHDARVSVEAGFRGSELSALWPASGWTLRERSAGPFTHFFSAYKNG
jgi:hypothetical protein